MTKIYIGYDNRISVASDVLIYSLKKYSSKPLDINLLKIDELNFKRNDPLASTSFTYTRFLVPYLNNYKGIALFMDNDMLAFADVNEILDLDMSKYAIRVVKHNHNPVDTIKMDGKIQTSYPRKNWSSFILMNCAKLKCWTKEAVETMSAAWLHRFEPIPDELIGDIPHTWNVLDELKFDTKLWHFTSGGPYFKDYANMPNAGVWYKAYYDMLNGR